MKEETAVAFILTFHCKVSGNSCKCLFTLSPSETQFYIIMLLSKKRINMTLKLLCQSFFTVNCFIVVSGALTAVCQNCTDLDCSDLLFNAHTTNVEGK